MNWEEYNLQQQERDLYYREKELEYKQQEYENEQYNNNSHSEFDESQAILITILGAILVTVGEPAYDLWLFVTEFIQHDLSKMNFFIYGGGIASVALLVYIIILPFLKGWGWTYVMLIALFFQNLDLMLTGKNYLFIISVHLNKMAFEFLF